MPYRATAAPELPPSELVVLDRYLDTFAAEIVRARLEAEGIRAFVTEAMRTNPLWNVAGGGTTVSVSSRDLDRARGVLAQLQRENVADEPDDEAEVRCPRCESEYCFFERPRLGGSKRWRCRKCEHTWDGEQAGRGLRRTVIDDDLRPVFRLRRGGPGMGLFLGLVAGASTGAIVGGAVGGLAFLAAPLLGWWVGASIRNDVCSEPACRVPLRPNAAECPACHGIISGIIHTSAEHHARAAEARREIAGELARTRKKIKKKRPKPAGG
jgi:hypothetical protein